MDRKVYKMAVSGLLIALSIVLTRIFSADILVVGVPAVRLAIGFVPIMLGGILLGPWFGMGIGALADILGYIVAPNGPYFPLITVTSMLAGMLPYIAMRLAKNLKPWLAVLLAVAATQIICSMFVQTLWLSILYGKAFEVLFVPRAIAALCTIPVYFALIYAILAALKKTGLGR